MDILRIKVLSKRTGKVQVIQTLSGLRSWNVLMTPNGSWAITAINEQAKFKIGTFMIPGKKRTKLNRWCGDLAWSISLLPNIKEANAFVEYIDPSEVMQKKYYDVDGSPATSKGSKPKQERIHRLLG